MNRRALSKAILKTIARGEDRSPLFWWFVENHDRIAAAAGKRIHWKGVCAEAAARGLTDANGNPASIRTARDTWRRAKLAVAEARERQAATPPPIGGKFPSRIPKSWRPSGVPPPPAGTALTPAPTAGQALSVAAGEQPPYDRERALAYLKQSFNKLSGIRDEESKWGGRPIRAKTYVSVLHAMLRVGLAPAC